MILIKKGKAPAAWVEYSSTPGVDYQAIPELYDSLLKEQGYLCAYCMRRIPVRDRLDTDAFQVDKEERKWTKEDHRIEHFKPRELYPLLKLQYANMFVCCPGYIGGESHCDRRKGAMEMDLSPLRQEVINTISYKSHDGTILSTNENWNRELNEVLNLNTPLLKLNRKSTLNGVISLLSANGKSQWSNNVMNSVLEKWKSLDGDLQRKEYCGIVIWFLEKKIR
ncbi:MAG: hypothetical protein IJV06_06075 [Bacteroidaceae bacterium]|nr:hypothetical protein [Bacteroidaceae bacterium]